MSSTHRAVGEDQIVEVLTDRGWTTTHLPLESFTLPFQLFVIGEFGDDYDDISLFETASGLIRDRSLREIADGLDQSAMTLNPEQEPSEEEKIAALAFIEAVAERLREFIEFG